MVPGSVTLIPLFVLMSKLGLVNTYAAVTVPFFAGAFGVFLMRQFMHSVPDDLIDAARIDGAGEWTIFIPHRACRSSSPRSPRSRSSSSWRRGTTSCGRSSSLTDQAKYTLAGRRSRRSPIGENTTDYGLLMAGSVVLVAPVIVLFIALQRYFVPVIALPAQVRTRRTRN